MGTSSRAPDLAARTDTPRIQPTSAALVGDGIEARGQAQDPRRGRHRRGRSELRCARLMAPRNLRPDRNPANPRGYCSGRYWARTSDLRLVEAALSQLS